jgi:hypothetical protein
MPPPSIAVYLTKLRNCNSAAPQRNSRCIQMNEIRWARKGASEPLFSANSRRSRIIARGHQSRTVGNYDVGTNLWSLRVFLHLSRQRDD